MSISEEGQPEMTADRHFIRFRRSTSSGSDPHSNQAMQEKSLELNGWQLLQEKHWGDAALVFGQLLEINRANEGALQGTIARLRKQGSFSEARSRLREALQLHPDSIGILCERAWLDVERKYDDAIDAFGAVLRRTQKDESLFRWRITLLRGQQRLDEAEKAIEEAKKAFPQSKLLLVERGWLLFYQNQFQEAADTFSDLLKLDKNNQEALQGRIRLPQTPRAICGVEESRKVRGSLRPRIAREFKRSRLAGFRARPIRGCGKEFQSGDDTYSIRSIRPRKSRLVAGAAKRKRGSGKGIEMLLGCAGNRL